MKADIQPITKLATDLGINLALDTYDHPLYAIERADGTQLTTTFSPQELDNFCPSKTVSEMMASWETDTTGKLEFVKYTYDPSLKMFPLLGELIPVRAKQDILSWCKKGDQVHVQAVFYDKRTLLVNDIWGWLKEDGTVHGMIRRPFGLAEDVPVGTIHQHPESKNKAVKMFEPVYAEVGTYRSLTIVTPKGTYPASLLAKEVSHYFEKISS
ncbi:MAG: hypothetical protein P8J32_04760 [bacterium]|nr:hypothetical protein [bacterium]